MVASTAAMMAGGLQEPEGDFGNVHRWLCSSGRTAAGACERAVLNDGTTVALRPLTPADGDRVLAYFDGLSPGSLYRRFHHRIRELSPGVRQAMVSTDGRRHVALGAFHGGSLVGASRYFRAADVENAAEVAFSVADAYQRRGLGRALLLGLARLARESGIDRFLFTVQGDNEPAVRLLTGGRKVPAGQGVQFSGGVSVDALLARCAERASAWNERETGQ
ncbi:MAG: GNAT family N-acetyltransferase [Ectothiorhodospiraceae bacterium]|jgi:GNAT superfamily N-acetyltransferase